MKNYKFKKVLYILALSLTCSLLGCKNNNNLPDPLEAGWKGEAVCNILEENKKIRILKCVFEPGVGHERHYHKPHFGYALAGSTFKITDDRGSREVIVPTGYNFKNDSITTHEVLNIGDSTGIFLIVEYK